MSELIRIAQAAQILQVTPATIRNMIERGDFPGARKISPGLRNSPFRIPMNEIQKYKDLQEKSNE